MLNLSAIGYLGNDATIKKVNDSEVINFSLAITRKYKDANGVSVEKTKWIDATMWNKPNLAPHLKKGTMVYVSGEPEINAYLANNSDVKGTQRLTVFELELLSSKKENNE